MNKVKINTVVKAIKGKQKELAKLREELYDLACEAMEIVDDCDEADNSLEDAIDALSRYL